MVITKEQFLEFEAVRLSGITDMGSVTVIEEFTGLSREQIYEILKFHDELKRKYIKKEWVYNPKIVSTLLARQMWDR